MSRPDSELIPRNKLAQHLAESGDVVAILDAASLPGLPERIESRQIAALCLFTGDLTETLRDVAPYLMRLAPENPLLRDYVNDGDVPWAMWKKRAGILMRTDLGLSELQRHFRRMLRVRTESGTFFFRFWEPATAHAYFSEIALSEDRGRWFYPREGGQIDAYLVPDLKNDGLRIYRADGPRPDHRPWENRPFTLHPSEVAALRATRINLNLEQMVRMMTQTFPSKVATISPADLERGLRRSVARAAEFGIRQRPNAFRLAAWDLHADGDFEDVDPVGELRQILEADLLEQDKMQRLLDRIADLGPANSDEKT
ncbi:DUF4123 domain-containing protein [Paracoccus aurantiacus]|uniref:DUF4123 domain-containing protein n=1 Tax=Paracoccus aurantiacus TaxID=2599412 RepID=A0A5C6S0M6_9RHOB|nr:DUF4123 domain-containing protein [Paracoccus aurantiacus]TXB68198.1 DUF4123 domain-containing protein [Paracoccus aurantiacus]